MLYTADLIQLVESHHLNPHLYADDTQVYGSCQLGESPQLLHRLSDCLTDVATWMRYNRLQLNTAKTEIIWCASSRRQHQIPQTPLTVGSDAVVPVRVVRDHGIYLNSDLLTRTHVVMTAAAARLIYCIRRSERITDDLISLHWLRVQERIVFKVAVLTYRAVHGTAPPYLSSELTHVADMTTRSRLRSSSTDQLIVPSQSEPGPSRSPVPTSGTVCRRM